MDIAVAAPSEQVLIFDTTLRDGEQSPGCSMNTEEKLVLARQLERLGVDIIEAGFPIASQGDFEAVQRVASEIRGTRVAGLCRCLRKDIDVAYQALKSAARPRIHTFLATSDIHLRYKLKMSREDALIHVRDYVAHARSLCDDIEFSPEDATRSDPDFLCEVLQVAVDSGATTLNIPDTVGYTMPVEYGNLIRKIRQTVKGENIVLSCHCHNDLGMAVANSLAAVAAGARQVECTINGIGERAGNCAMEEVVMSLFVRSDVFPYKCGVDRAQIYATSQLLSQTLGFNVQPNKAIVGRNAFAHEAGIHQHGVLSNPICYEIMTPESVGMRGERIVLGKHSGRHALMHRFNELGLNVSSEELEALYTKFTHLADRKKKVYDQDLISMVATHRGPVSDSPNDSPNLVTA
jgi:2-isopropylmalate synthase